LNEGESRSRFAYFGQLTPYKGVDLLIDAFSRLPQSLKRVSLDIFGGGLDRFGEAFERRIRDLLDANTKRVCAGMVLMSRRNCPV
jgi:glycosyltransferase involved in cell wall biosynthesis